MNQSMRCTEKIVSVLLMASFLGMLSVRVLPGQAMIPPRPAAEQVRTMEVLVDVIVTDKAGNPVNNLRPEEFSVLENDIPQTIRSLWLETVSEKGALPEPAGQTVAGIKQVQKSSPGLITLLFDNLSMSPQSRSMAVKAAREAIERWPAESMLSLFVMENRLSLLYPANGDRQGLAKALEQVVSRKGRPYASSSAELQRQLQAMTGTAAENVARARNASSDETDVSLLQLQALLQFEDYNRDTQAQRSVLGLLSLIRSQQAIPGRKTIILFSDGFSIPASIQNQYQSVVGLANRANLTLYTIDAGGLRLESEGSRSFQELSALGAARGGARSDPSLVEGGRSSLGRSEELARMDGVSVLNELSDKTGGLHFHNSNDITSALEKVRRDMSAYYLLSYQPTNLLLDGSFRKIQVRVSRPDVRVRARSGYEALPFGNVGSQLDYEKPLWEAMTRDSAPTDIPMKTALWRFPSGPERDWVLVQAAIPASVLTFSPGPAPAGTSSKKKGESEKFLQARLDAMAVIQNQRGYILDKKSRFFDVVSAENRLEEVRKATIDFSRSFSVPPETGMVVISAREAGTSKLSVLRTALPEPSGSGNQLRVSSLVPVRGVEPVKPGEDGNDPMIYEKSRILPRADSTFRKSQDNALRFYFTVLTRAGSVPAIKMEFLQKGQVLLESAGVLPAADPNGIVRFLAEFPSEPFSAGDYILRIKVDGEKDSCKQQQPFSILP